MDYSVLMSVYYKERPEYLELAIQSILNQTMLTNDFVIVEDGELTDELENIITFFETQNRCFHIIRRKKNMGLGYSLAEGVKACKNNVIARMDSDDYSLPNRCEEELRKIEQGYDLVGTNIEEFQGDISNVIAEKKMPSNIQEIKEYAKYRNPFNHPSVMFKKNVVIDAGNYHDIFRLEDYELWIRLIQSNIKCCNIDLPLVKMRVNNEYYKRRGGKENLKSHISLKKMMLEAGMISRLEYIKGVILMTARAYCPGRIKQTLYKKLLRR